MPFLALMLALLSPPQSAPEAVSVSRIQALPDSIPRAVSRARKVRRLEAKQTLSAFVCFKFADPKAAQDCADAVSDPASPLYGHWLTPQEIGERFGPSQADYDAVGNWLKAQGLTIEETSANRMTLRAGGSAAQMEKAFGVALNEYKEDAKTAVLRGPDETPRTFFAPSAPLQLPAAFAGKISSVEGLESWTRPVPARRAKRAGANGPFDAVQVRTAYNLNPLYNAGFQGQGRTIAISNYDGFSLANARRYVNYNGLPYPAAGAATNVTVIKVASSSGAAGVGEGDLDIQMALAMAPLANILVYDNGKPGNNNVPQNVLAVLAREVSDNRADVITESYGWPVTDAAQINSWHTQHVMMTMQGITYLVASGDTGSIVQYQYPYPDLDPEVMSIGGTIMTLNPNNTIAAETGWSLSSGSGGGGGYNAAAFDFNVLPAWEKGRSVPTDQNYRLVPDIALHSAGPIGSITGAYNYYWIQTLLGIANGTSFASPLVAASLLDIEQYLISQNALPANSAGKQRLGRLNDRIYAFNGRNDIFHDITTGDNGFPAGPYWDYVTGWGTPDFYNLAAALTAPLAVTVTANAASIAPGQSLPLTANVSGSNVKEVVWSVDSGPGTISTSGVYTAPTTVTGIQTVVIKATSVIDTANPGNTSATVQPDPVFGTLTLTLNAPVAQISGTILLDGILDPAQTIVPTHPFTFVLRPDGGVPITLTQTLGANGAFQITSVPRSHYTLAVKGDRWLRQTLAFDATGGDVSGLRLRLPGGDADNSNAIDINDFGVLVNAYNGDAAVSGSSYDFHADFNCDGVVDIADFGILVNNYNKTGAP